MALNYGHCYNCERHVNIQGNPAACLHCRGEFVEIFDIPAAEVIPSARVATTSTTSSLSYTSAVPKLKDFVNTPVASLNNPARPSLVAILKNSSKNSSRISSSNTPVASLNNPPENSGTSHVSFENLRPRFSTSTTLVSSTDLPLSTQASTTNTTTPPVSSVNAVPVYETIDLVQDPQAREALRTMPLTTSNAPTLIPGQMASNIGYESERSPFVQPAVLGVNRNLENIRNNDVVTLKAEPREFSFAKPAKVARLDKENIKVVEKEEFLDKKSNDYVDCACPICFEEWDNSGHHRLVSLKCGHLFGESCIRRWLGTNHKCSQCNTANKITDIRVIFAKTLRASNTAELETEKKLRIDAEAKLNFLKREIEQSKTRVSNGATVFSSLSPQVVVSSSNTQLASSSTPQITSNTPMAYGQLSINRTIGSESSGGFYSLKNSEGFYLVNGRDEIAVSSTYRNKIVVFDSLTGRELSLFGCNMHHRGGFHYPGKIAMTRSNKFVVVDRDPLRKYENRVKIFSAENGFFERTIVTSLGRGQRISAIEINITDDIVILGSCMNYDAICRNNNLSFLTQSDDLIKTIALPTAMIRAPNDFVINDNKYFICGARSVVCLDENGSILLRFDTSLYEPCGICISPNNDVLLITFAANKNGRSMELKICVYDSTGKLKKELTDGGQGLVRQCSGLRMLPDGSLVTTTKKKGVLVFNPCVL